MSYLSIFDFLENETYFLNKWQDANNYGDIMRFCKYIETYYNLDDNNYNCRIEQKVIIKRIKHMIRGILVFEHDIAGKYKKIVKDINLLHRVAVESREDPHRYWSCV